MAKYNILRLNKMSSGMKRGLIDMNLKLDYTIAKDLLLLDRTVNLNGKEHEDAGICTETGDYEYVKSDYISDFKPAGAKQPLAHAEDATSLVLNETQFQIHADSLSDDLSVNQPYAIQLTPESWLSDQVQLSTVEMFNSKYSNMHVVYEFEKQKAPNAKTVLEEDIATTVLPLNDILDVCIKSRFKKSAINSNVPHDIGQPRNEVTKNKNVDLYLALEDYPVDFCQCNNDAYLVTQPTTKTPYFYKSDLEESLRAGNKTLQHQFNLVRDDIMTYTYKTPMELGESIGQALSTYRAYLSGDLSRSSYEAMISVFSPGIARTNINYNYIIGFDQNGNSNYQYDNPTKYETGDLYGHFMIGKNMYNSLYSMEMSSSSTLSCCRTYCGIQNSQNKVLLKYYDDMDYVEQAKDGDGNSTMRGQRRYADGEVPYQKVEFLYPTAVTKQNKHKSNLFSLKLKDTGLDDESVEAARQSGVAIDQELVEKIKCDISNGIRALADTIAPANTQLFKTYFIP